MVLRLHLERCDRQEKIIKTQFTSVLLYISFLASTLGVIFLIAMSSEGNFESVLLGGLAFLGLGFIFYHKKLTEGHSYLFGKLKLLNFVFRATDKSFVLFGVGILILVLAGIFGY